MAEELRALPNQAKDWANQITLALNAKQTEFQCLRDQLSHETAFRRKLHHEVQDLRGNVRVYCRPRPIRKKADDVSIAPSQTGILSVPSHEIINLTRKNTDISTNSNTITMSFEYDRVFHSESTQKEVYSEMEELILGALDGYVLCVMAFGQTGSGKTHTLFGQCHRPSYDSKNDSAVWIERRNAGVYFETLNQLLTVSECRSERFQDSFSITILEVHGDKLCDLCAGTSIANNRGEVQGRAMPHNSSKSISSRRSRADETSNNSSFAGDTKSGQGRRLEIRTNYDGDTIVQGLISIPIKNMDDVWSVWDECLAQRHMRLRESNTNIPCYDAESHIFATVNIVSTNIATGVGTVGKIQFVDLAGADVAPKRGRASHLPLHNLNSARSNKASIDDILTGVGNNLDWKFSNKSITTLNDVVYARSQFTRTVPYRNSTLTHLLRDSLEGDAKVLMLLCLSSEEQDLQVSQKGNFKNTISFPILTFIFLAPGICYCTSFCLAHPKYRSW